MIPAPLASHTVALLLGANLTALVCVGLMLLHIRRRIRDLTAIHHDLVAKLLLVRGAKLIGPFEQSEIEGQAQGRAA